MQRKKTKHRTRIQMKTRFPLDYSKGIEGSLEKNIQNLEVLLIH